MPCRSSGCAAGCRRWSSSTAARCGPRTAAYSFHRQVVDAPPETLAVSGWSEGVAEVVEGGRWLGVQWHPERLGDLRPYRWLAAQL